jgi:methyl-accepting chemotaxis protein
LITLATIVVTLFVSHKLAGPMFRFEADLEVIGKGDLTKKIRLRKKDQLKDVVVTLNRMTENLHEKVTGIHRDIVRLSETAENIGVSPELIKELNDLRGKIESNFKL